MTLVQDECCDVEVRFREYARVAAIDAYNIAEQWSIDAKRATRAEVVREMSTAVALLEMVREIVGNRFTHTCCGVDLIQFAIAHDAVNVRLDGAPLVLPVFGAVFVGDPLFDDDHRMGLSRD